jgi:hypothetical protein
VPIVERTPAACYNKFVEHVRALVAETITTQHPVMCIRRGDDSRRQLEFANGEPVQLTTKYGPLYFHVAQLLGVEPEGKQWRLVTLKYWYRLQQQSKGQAVIRWEYERDTPGDRHARHHVQIRGTAQLVGAEPLDLNKLHIPTGWTTIEEVIRFLIHDLGILPPCGGRWHEVLAQSERTFYEKFTGKRYRSNMT